jgi:hypothetical protein
MHNTFAMSIAMTLVAKIPLSRLNAMNSVFEQSPVKSNLVSPLKSGSLGKSKDRYLAGSSSENFYCVHDGDVHATKK